MFHVCSISNKTFVCNLVFNLAKFFVFFPLLGSLLLPLCRITCAYRFILLALIPLWIALYNSHPPLKRTIGEAFQVMQQHAKGNHCLSDRLGVMMAVVCGDFQKAVEDSSSTCCIKTGPCGSGWGEETDSCPTG